MKDVGRIPYHLARERGWNCTLLYCQPFGPPISDAEYEAHVRIRRLATTDSRVFKFALLTTALVREARRTDVLNLYQLGLESAFYATLYRALNPAGICFLKLDMDAPTSKMLLARRRTWRRILNDYVISRSPIDFFTVETTQMYRLIEDYFVKTGIPLRLLPNGFSGPRISDAELAGKERLVLTVGRLGMPQKNSELLLDAIERLPRELAARWQFYFVGAATRMFQERTRDLLARRPDLESRVTLLPHTSDRAELFDLYRRASIFCLTSRWESYALVLLEALYFGCYVISTRVGAAEDLVTDDVGTLLPPDDSLAFHRALEKALRRTYPLDVAKAAHLRVAEHYNWNAIVERLEIYIADAKRARRSAGLRKRAPSPPNSDLRSST